MIIQRDDPTVELNLSECWGLLRDAVVGRLAVILPDQLQPDIFPINYVVDHGSIVFRTNAGTKLSASVDCAVAFEVDSYDSASGMAWSVVVKGTAREVRKFYDVLDGLELPLFPWHAGPKPRIVRVEPDTVSGRRFRIVDVPTEHPAVTRAAPE